MDNFWFDLFLIISIFSISIFVINIFLRKWLKVDRKKFFSYDHVNDKHNKIDWTVRIIFIIFMFIGFFTNATRHPDEPIWFIQPHIILFFLLFSTEIIRAIMEKKYSENPNDYLFTSIQLVIIALFIASLFMTNFWGLVDLS